MRTVVFSDEGVAREMNARFVSSWLNRRPEARFHGTPDVRELPLGAGADNVTSIFSTPDGLVLNAVPGYLDAANFLKEMRLALALHERLRARGLNGGTYAQAHRDFDTGNRIARLAHDRLAKAGLPRIEELRPGYFDGLAPRAIG